MSDELFESVEQEPMGAALEPLKADCQEAVDLDKEIKSMEELLKSMKKRLHTLRTRIIPDRMAEAGVGDVFSTADGYTLKIGQFVMGGLPKEDEDVLEDGPSAREKAIAELIRLGGESLIKEKVALSFDKGEYEKAVEAKEALKSLGYDYVEVEETVHAGSYKAFAREAFNKGVDIDLSALGVEIMPQVRITAPKG